MASMAEKLTHNHAIGREAKPQHALNRRISMSMKPHINKSKKAVSAGKISAAAASAWPRIYKAHRLSAYQLSRRDVCSNSASASRASAQAAPRMKCRGVSRHLGTPRRTSSGLSLATPHQQAAAHKLHLLPLPTSRRISKKACEKAARRAKRGITRRGVRCLKKAHRSGANASNRHA